MGNPAQWLLPFVPGSLAEHGMQKMAVKACCVDRDESVCGGPQTPVQAYKDPEAVLSELAYCSRHRYAYLELITRETDVYSLPVLIMQFLAVGLV